MIHQSVLLEVQVYGETSVNEPDLIHGEADSGGCHQLVPVSGPDGRVLELCHSPEGDEGVLHHAVQTYEGVPRPHLPDTKPRVSKGTLIVTRKCEALI